MKMSLPEGVHTHAGRLASFSISYRLPRKSRASSANSKSQILLAWPHQRPSPEQLAQAGFYYRPSQESPDSVECFLCRKGLDGWEEDDNPIEEHLKHSADCGWAVNTCIEQKSEEQKRDDNGDHLSERMMAARRVTFADRWPHEGKKGWLCKITKMVEAGWYYCPTPDSDDFVSCAYCGLSLDGWEPKDNPMEEHQRRSPMCPFFTTATLPAINGKPTKAKKGRASKLSLASTQSANWTTFSANSSFAEVLVEEGDSIMSTATRLAAKGKKSAAAKGRSRTKKNEPAELSSFVEPEDDSFDVKVPEKPMRTTRGKKRTSAEMDADERGNERQGSVDTVTEVPPAKRRTRTRSSLAQVQSFPVTAPAKAPGEEVVMLDADEVVPAATKKGGKGRKTRNSTAKLRGRKTSAASTASMASMRMEIDIPDDDEIDRALEADLDRPLTDDEAENIEVEEVPKRRRLTRSRVPSAKAATTVRKASRANKMVVRDVEMGEAADAMANHVQPEPEIPQPSVTAPKGKQTRKASAKQKPGPRSKPNVAEQTHSRPQASLLEEAQSLERADEPSLLNSSILGDVASPPPITRPKRAASRKPSRQVEKRGTRASAMSAADSHILPSSETGQPALDEESNSGDESADSMASQATVRRGGPKQQGAAGKRGRGVKNNVMGSKHIEDVVQKRVEAAAEQKKDEVMEEGKPKRGKKGNMNVNSQKAGDLQIDMDVDGRTEAAVRAVKPLPDIPPAKATKAKGGRKAMAAEKTASTMPNEVAGGETAVTVLAGGEPALGFAAPAQLPQSKAVKEKISAAKATPSSPETISVLPVGGHREEHQQATPDPSNASDAENQPPSSRPSASTPFRAYTARIPLAASTPTASSPSKRNVVTGLQTSLPWTTIDLEAVFLPSPTSPSIRRGGDEDADKENRGVGVSVTDAMKGLTSPEKKMTVGEWIGFCAKREEERLREECERLVGVFEREGNRAMRALEGIEVAE
ncbi:hypothetical protein FGG08_007279 [Glutinoglossum americanum]|uniref:Survivin n=1 Tax=Glutinoglossum americanum TaxID=1670608 RepID=A0A9P8HR47_9PEZI|nr:hypothetical protein FGG08_007279 [Glutinoglossum americanum]